MSSCLFDCFSPHAPTTQNIETFFSSGWGKYGFVLSPTSFSLVPSCMTWFATQFEASQTKWFSKRLLLSLARSSPTRHPCFRHLIIIWRWLFVKTSSSQVYHIAYALQWIMQKGFSYASSTCRWSTEFESRAFQPCLSCLCP